MSVSAFKYIIDLIRNGEAVDEQTINRALRQLQGNAQFLKDVFEAAALGETVFARAATVESGAATGMPVYYNSASQRWERAQAVADFLDNEVVLPAKAQVWGIVHTKYNSTLADLLLLGVADVDLSAAVSGTVAAGQYYLSGMTAGGLTSSPPPLPLPVLQVAGAGASAGTHKVFVRPSTTDFFNAHQHYKFDLVCAPAGIAQLAGGRWEVVVPDANAAGWLPADHASFSGNAPAGAVFGYNMDKSPIGSVWPPSPLSSVYFEWNRGDDRDVGGTSVPQGPRGLIIADANGIWWLSDCTADVPWSDEFDSPSTTTSTTSTTTSSSSTTTTPECPRALQMQLTCWFVKMAFQTSNAAVTSLRVADDSSEILTLRCVNDGLPATAGDLELSINLALLVDDADDASDAYAFKQLNSGNTLKRGPVVGGLKAGSANVVLSGGTLTGDYRHGNVVVTVVEGVVGGELPVSVVRLDGVTEENYGGLPSIGFPKARTTTFSCKIKVPVISGATTVSVVWRGWLLGRTAGSLPTLTATYRRIPRPSPTTTPVALPTTDSALTFNTATLGSYTANYYAELSSGTIVAAPGDELLINITRPGAGGDSYNEEIHVISQVGVITGVA